MCLAFDVCLYIFRKECSMFAVRHGICGLLFPVALTNVMWLLEPHLIIIVWSVKSCNAHSKHTLRPFTVLIRTHKNLLNKSHSIIVMIIYSFIYNRHYVCTIIASLHHHPNGILNSTLFVYKRTFICRM